MNAGLNGMVAHTSPEDAMEPTLEYEGADRRRSAAQEISTQGR